MSYKEDDGTITTTIEKPTTNLLDLIDNPPELELALQKFLFDKLLPYLIVDNSLVILQQAAKLVLLNDYCHYQ